MPASISERQYIIINALLNREYDEFKRVFPNEEPFWKISCVNKHKRPYMTEADKKMNWRSIVHDSKEDIKITEIKEVTTQKRKYTDKVTTKQERVKIIAKDVVKKDIPITRKERYTETTEEEYQIESFDSKISSLQIDMHRHVAEPNFMSIIKLDVKTQTITDEIIGLWGDMKITGAILDSDKMAHMSILEKLKEIKKTTQDVIDQQAEIISKLQVEVAMLKSQVNEVKQIDVSELSHIKKEWTMNEIITKYVEMQKKLTHLKIKIQPILDKHERLNHSELVKKHGFVGSLIEVIKYFDEEYEEPESLSDYD